MSTDWSLVASVVTASAALVAALASAWSAASAREANRSLAKAERARRVRELSLLAHKVDVGATDVVKVGSQRLRPAIDALFSLAGRTGSGAHAQEQADVDENLTSVTPLQDYAVQLFKTDLDDLSDELIANHLAKLEAHLVHIERIRQTIEGALASVDAQRSRMV